MHKHYSHGKLYSTTIYIEAENCCENMETYEMTNMSASCKCQKQDDCSCKNETETFKLNTNFIVSKKQKIAEISVFDIITTYCSLVKTHIKVLDKNIQIIDISPPDKSLNTQSEFGVFIC